MTTLFLFCICQKEKIMDIENIVDEMYNNMLERCGIEKQEKPEIKEKIEEKVKEGIGAGVKFERIRRITGYLVGDVSRWNNGKRAELNDRNKHDTI